MYRILFTARYDREYEKLPLDVRRKADEQVQRLRLDPAHPSLRTHKRAGTTDLWQARITRSYRLFFTMEGNTITLTDIAPHEK